MPNEEWREIPGYPGYQVNGEGRVMSRLSSTPKEMKPTIDSNGYAYFQLYLGNRRWKHEYAHRLLLAAFVGPCPDGMQGCHNDGDKANNSIANLRWDTSSANHVDTNTHGRGWRGSRNPAIRLGEQDVLELLRLRKEGAGATWLSRRFNICLRNVYCIIDGDSWSWLTGRHTNAEAAI